MTDDPETYHLGIGRINFEVLASVLHFPEDHRIIAVRPRRDGDDSSFEILIEGPTLPETLQSESTPEVNIVCRQETGDLVPERRIIVTFEIVRAAGKMAA